MRTTAQEKNFENKVKEYLTSKGAWFVKFFANSHTKKGVPDVLACVNGYFVGVEVKGDAGKPSKLQLRNIDKIRCAGGFAMVLYPSAFDRFQKFVDGLLHDCFTRDSEVIWK